MIAAERYTEFSSRLHRKVGAARIPIEGTIEISHRCPLECAHCYNNLPMSDSAARGRELTLEDHRRLLDELAEAGCLWLLYTGGEIFARRDFLDIYTHAKRKGFIITLFTNGTLVTPKIADYLVEWRPFQIEITLYGRTRETYEALTGIPGSYDKCLRGIRLLKERNLPLKLKTVALTINRHEIWDMKRFAEEELGVEFKFDAMMSPRIDCSQSPLAVRLTPAEIVQLDIEDPKRKAEWRNFADRFDGVAGRSDGDQDLYHCGGGISSFAVDPYGELSICVLSHQDSANVRNGNFRHAWETYLNEVRGRKATLPNKCTTCRIKAMCGMCPANGELENGDPEKPVDFLCHVAHLRAHAFGIDVPGHGECEYCVSGSKHEVLLKSAATLEAVCGPGGDSTSLKSRPKQRFMLPVLKNSASTGQPAHVGGCSTCGIH